MRRSEQRGVRPLDHSEHDAGVCKAGRVRYQVGGRRNGNGADLEIATLSQSGLETFVQSFNHKLYQGSACSNRVLDKQSKTEQIQFDLNDAIRAVGWDGGKSEWRPLRADVPVPCECSVGRRDLEQRAERELGGDGPAAHAGQEPSSGRSHYEKKLRTNVGNRALFVGIHAHL